MIKRKYDIAELRERVRYEPDTGRLFWVRPFERAYRVKAGTPAFTSLNRCYRQGSFGGQGIYAHVAAWLIHYGEYPIGDIDHINQDGSDNRISNLRDVPHAVNGHNAGVRSHNTSGHKGVSLRKTTGRWHSYINVDGKRKQLGTFADINDAVAARRDAELRHFPELYSDVR